MTEPTAETAETTKLTEPVEGRVTPATEDGSATEGGSSPDDGSSPEDGSTTEDGSATAPESPPSRYRDLPPVNERDLAARARGLSSAYIDGGDDPDIVETRRKEAVYRWLLIAMIVAIVGLGLIVTFVGFFVPGVG